MQPAHAPKSRSAPPKRKGTVAALFSQEIARAVEEGKPPTDLTLRLTLSDFAELKRDATVALEDISFRNGEMRFLGVKVSGGGVEASRLDCGAA